MSQKIIGIIPARYASTRYPGKPLADVSGQPMIQRVYDQAKACKGISKLIVATDDERIQNCVVNFGGEVEMTSAEHANGTERCAEAAKKHSADYIVNIPCDEPFVRTEQIQQLIEALDGKTQIATLVKKITSGVHLNNPNSIKVALTNKKEVLYFSRAPIPYLRGYDPADWVRYHEYYIHIPAFAYKTSILKKIAKTPPSQLEKGESLEQLRWLEHGINIQGVETELDGLKIRGDDQLQLKLGGE